MNMFNDVEMDTIGIEERCTHNTREDTHELLQIFQTGILHEMILLQDDRDLRSVRTTALLKMA